MKTIKSHEKIASNSKCPDTTTYKKFKGNIYIDKNGNIAFHDISKPECDTCPVCDVYIDAAIMEDIVDGVYHTKPLRQLIDTSSLVILNDLFFKDKKRAFCFRPRDQSGWIYFMKEADVKSFRTFTDSLVRIAYDKNYFYELDERLDKKSAAGLRREPEN